LNNPKKSYLLIYFLLFIFCGFSHTEVKTACIKNTCIKVEVARTNSEKEKGLMDRKSLAQDEGMLFVFEEEKVHAFWMKNMRFPLDIIWLDASKNIVEIYKNAQPCKETCDSIIPKAASVFVLEVPAGFVEENNIKVADTLEF